MSELEKNEQKQMKSEFAAWNCRFSIQFGITTEKIAFCQCVCVKEYNIGVVSCSFTVKSIKGNFFPSIRVNFHTSTDTHERTVCTLSSTLFFYTFVVAVNRPTLTAKRRNDAGRENAIHSLFSPTICILFQAILLKVFDGSLFFPLPNTKINITIEK